MGRAILQGLSADKSVAAIHTLGRRPLAIEHPKLTQHVVDFRTGLFPLLPAVQEAFLALGTTIKVAAVLLREVPVANGVRILPSGEMRR